MGFLPQMSAGGPLGALSGGNTPQDWNQGLQNAPFTPHSTGPGVTPGQQSPDPNFNFNQPGYGEGFFQQNQGRFTAPTQSGNYFQQAMSQYPTAPQVSNNAQTEYNNFRAPHLSENAGLDPYYQNAANHLSARLNNEFGSRGMYGSSAATSQIGHGLGDLFADQANREAQYALQRSAEDRGWTGLGGQLAGQADQSSRAGSQNELAWLTGLGGLAGQADQSNLAQLMGGMQGALGAQDAMRGRGQDMFNNTMGPALAMMGMTNDAYNDMLTSDAQNMMNAIMLETGLAQAALQGSLYNQGRQKDDASWAKGMLNGKGGKGGK
jgi:hypothetical protein